MDYLPERIEMSKLKTEVEIGEYKGSPTITIWELDKNGERPKFPLVSFGAKKAEAILTHIEDIKKFVDSQTVRVLK